MSSSLIVVTPPWPAVHSDGKSMRLQADATHQAPLINPPPDLTHWNKVTVAFTWVSFCSCKTESWPRSPVRKQPPRARWKRFPFYYWTDDTEHICYSCIYTPCGFAHLALYLPVFSPILNLSCSCSWFASHPLAARERISCWRHNKADR